jgi:plastocyanin
MNIRRSVRSTAIAAVVVLGSATLSACGGDAKGAADPAMPTMTMVPVQSAAPPAAHADPLAVTIRDFAFSPATLTVKVGQTVTWTNQDEEPHTVVGDALKSPVLGNAGSTYKHTFAATGTYTYVCSIHPYMHGTVTVTR